MEFLCACLIGLVVFGVTYSIWYGVKQCRQKTQDIDPKCDYWMIGLCALMGVVSVIIAYMFWKESSEIDTYSPENASLLITSSSFQSPKTMFPGGYADPYDYRQPSFTSNGEPHRYYQNPQPPMYNNDQFRSNPVNFSSVNPVQTPSVSSSSSSYEPVITTTEKMIANISTNDLIR